MGRTRLFHTVVIIGSGLLASCDKGIQRQPQATASAKKDAGVSDAPPAVMVMAPDPPRIHAVTPEKMGQPPDPPIMPAPRQPRIQAAPRLPRI